MILVAYFQQVVDSYCPWSHDPAACRAIPMISPHVLPMIPWSRKSITSTHPHSCMPTWQPQLPVLAASAVESLVCLGQSFIQVLDHAKPNPWLAQAVARCRIRICGQAANSCAAEFRDSLSSHQPISLMSFPVWPRYFIVQPMFINNLHCWFFFDEPTAP